MNIFKTNDIECKVKIKILGKEACFQIDTGERMELVQLPQNIIKKQFTDGAFVKHILNFFIKE